MTAVEIGGHGRASADEDQRPFSVGLELAAGSMLSAYQRDTLGYDKDLQAALVGGYSLVPNLDIELAFRNWWFPSSRGYGRATLVGAGVRDRLFDGDVGAAFLEGTLGLGLNGSNARFMFDVGAGYGFHLTDTLDLGPILRYGQVAAGGADAPESAKFWSLGAAATYRFGGSPGHESPAPKAPGDNGQTAAPTVAVASVERPSDRDHDGVDDLHDACPDVPQGAKPNPDKAGCPDGDFDKDGVVDHEDQCPADASGLHPDPAKPGCPLADRDGDSVPDAEDHCPDKAGAPSPDPKRNGCPGLVKIDAGQIEIKTPVFFATNNDTILRRSFRVLTAVADVLRATPNIKRVDVQGHTDAQGNAEHNLDLSRRRAERVRLWLIIHGVEAARLEAHGFGGDRPVATNKTGAGRATNRRVEFLITDPALASGATQAAP